MTSEAKTQITRRRLLAAGLAGATAIASPGAADSLSTLPNLVDRCRFGAASSTGSGLINDHRELESLVRATLPICSWFKDWGTGWNVDVGREIGDLASKPAYDCMIGWEAWGVHFSDILDGSRDQFFSDFFDGAKTYLGRVILRPFHEMNGDWYPWSVSNSSQLVTKTEEWKEAWRRMVRIARSRDASNVKFMFCANHEDVGGIPVEQYWPGGEWTDLVGLDGYNWGWQSNSAPLQTAEQVIEPMYGRLTTLDPDAVVMVGELGCAPGRNKSAWFEDLFTSRKFPRLTQVSFFNEKKEKDWRLNSDADTLAVVRRYLSRAPQNSF